MWSEMFCFGGLLRPIMDNCQQSYELPSDTGDGFACSTCLHPPLGRNAHPYDLSLNCISLLVIFRLCRSDIFAAQKRYCRFAAAILYSPPKLPVGQYNLRSKYNWRSQYNSQKANIAEKDSDCDTIRVFFWQGHKDLNPEPTVLETAALPIELYPYISLRRRPE